MRRLMALGLVWGLSGCVKYVVNQPRAVQLDGQEEEAVRAVLMRSIDHRRFVIHQDVEGLLAGEAKRSPVPCGFTLAYTADQATVTTSGPVSPQDPGQIDARCDELGARLARGIQNELTRPERLARKEEKRRRKQEAIDARNRAWAAQAAAAAAQQPVAAPPPPLQPPPQALAPEPPRRHREHHRSAPAAPPPSSSPPRATPFTPQTTISRHDASPPPPPPGPTLQPNTCCVARRAYLCPNVATYAAACVQKTVPLASTCPPAPAHDRFCP